MKTGLKWVLCFMCCVLLVSSAFAQSYNTAVSIDIKLGGEIYTNTFNVRWQDSLYGYEAPDGMEVLGMIRVLEDNVPIYEEHSVSSKIVEQAYKGDAYLYINTRSYDEGWYQISSGGWISMKHVERLSAAEMDAYLNPEYSIEKPYTVGDSGEMVLWIQKALSALKYYDGTLNSAFDESLKKAVQDFQNDHGLEADGVAGEQTIEKLREELKKAIENTSNSGNFEITDNIIYNLDWFTYLNNGVLKGFGIEADEKVTLMDIKTRKTFNAKILSMGNHIDAEPWSSGDTEVLASIYGKTSGSDLKGIYKRLPLVLTTKYGFSVIVSIYPEPRGEDAIMDNGYDGQFCLYMSGSKAHGTDRVDEDTNGHQEMIRKGVARLIDPNGEYDIAVSTAFPATTASTSGTVSGGHGSSNVILPELVPPPVTLQDNTTVYFKSNWKYWHWTTSCPRLDKVSTSGADMTYKSRPTAIPECPECSVIWVYYGNTNSMDFHYSQECPKLLSERYGSIYMTTETYADSQHMTHVCGYCNADGSTTPLPDPVKPVENLYNKTTVYFKSNWKYWHWTLDCPRLSKSDTSGSAITYKMRPEDIPECVECNAVWVVFGDTSSADYHYSAKCTELLSEGYNALYWTTKTHAESDNMNRTHTCAHCVVGDSVKPSL